jgi:2-oxoglutarate ferredoxin oxidoreductase subunit delta
MAKQGIIKINNERCKGCYLCVRACPAHILSAGSAANAAGVRPAQVATGAECKACGACHAVCPDMCVSVYEVVEQEDACRQAA